MIETSVFQRDGGWYFAWRNLIDRQMPVSQAFDGPFTTRHDAERVRQDFVDARAAKRRGETIVIG